MYRKELFALATGVALLGAFAAPALAETVASSTTARMAPKVDLQCVGSAVSARETAIDTAVTTLTTSLNSAYSTRASALASAYAGTDAKTVRAGSKVAWSNFSSSVRTARKAYSTARQSAWTTFRAAARLCKGGSTVSDSEGASTEIGL